VLHTGVCSGNLRETDRLKYLGIDGRIILKWIVKKSVVEEHVLHSFGPGWGQVVGCREFGNEHSCVHKMRGVS
jgi:hypothetical protein